MPSLANIDSTRGPIPPGVFLERINQSSIKTRTTEQPTNVEAEKGTKTEQVAAANQTSNEEDNNMAVKQEDATLEGPPWTKPFLKFLIHGTLPQDIS